jgi:hypothetical protein
LASPADEEPKVLTTTIAATLLLWTATTGDAAPDWDHRAKLALAKAQTRGTVDAFEEAFDAVWRADDWQAGLTLARRAQKKHANHPALIGRSVRALWRAGRLSEAETLAKRIPRDTKDRVAARMGIQVSLASRQADAAQAWAKHLQKLGTREAEDVYTLIEAQISAQQMDGLAKRIRELERLLDPRHGYPEEHLSEAITGLADFFKAAGPQPINQITRFGHATMTPLVMFNLPAVETTINGHGPYRLIIDTGGSYLLALDETVAEEAGLKFLAESVVRGVGGRQTSRQALVDQLQIGTIQCTRVMTHAFAIRESLMNAADGIIGTGIFSDARMTLDFTGSRLVVAPSSTKTAPGKSGALRIVADAKLIALMTLESEPAIALLDTGADMVAVSPARMKALFPDSEMMTFDLGSVAIGVGNEQAPQLSLGDGVDFELVGRTYENSSGIAIDVLDTVLSPIIGVQIDLLVGMSTFRDTRSVTIDYPTARVWFDWIEPN